MYRPSQTPHPTLSSARIASQNKFPTERKKLKAAERTKTPAETETPAHPAAPPQTPARTAQASTQESSQTRQSTPRGGRQLAAHSATPRASTWSSPTSPTS